MGCRGHSHSYPLGITDAARKTEKLVKWEAKLFPKEMVMETITLREVALRLAKIKSPATSKIDDGQLLSLLRSGDLKAGFEFPGATKRWVPIEGNYWVTVDSQKLRSIRSDEDYTYKVRLSDFAQGYSRLVLSDSSHETLKDEFPVALAAAPRRYEVVVQSEEWKKYLVSHDLKEPPFDLPKPKGKGGRNPLAGWNHLAVIIPAYLLAHHSKTRQPPNYEVAADQIYDIALKKGIDPATVPQPGALKDVISNVYKEKESILNI
jgi:hypothetical protein